MSAAKIAAALDSARREGRGWRCNCPVHGGRSLVINDGRDGRLLIRCWGGNCDARDILTALRKRNLLGNPRARWAQPSDPDAMQRHREAEERNRQHRIAVALDLWQNETYPATDTIVERYLRSRGIIIPPPATIRMAGLMRHRESGEQRPAMVALVEHVEHGPIAVHITYIALDGSMKATIAPNKRSLGPVGGGAVRLVPSCISQRT
jgi:putative DNA primase/helicase